MTSMHRQIREKVEKKERLSPEEGVWLLRSCDVHRLGELADTVRVRLWGDRTFYNVNRHINYSNICALSCAFCSFRRSAGQEGAYAFGIDEILAKAGEAERAGATELHMVGGLHPTLPFEWYGEMLSAIRERYPSLHLKAFTAVEIDHFSHMTGRSVEEVLQVLIDSGLQSMPGGGAEVFSERVRRKLFAGKIGADRWLAIHESAHRLGLRSNATLLYGHIETDEEIIEHLCRLREQQDRSGGFQTLVPLCYHPENNRLGGTLSTGLRDLHVIATARLMLDNFAHIKAFWIMLGLKLSQVALAFGVDDLDGTVVEERITHMAGATTPEGLTVTEIEALICEARRTPVERNTLYEPVRRDRPLETHRPPHDGGQLSM